MNLFKSKWSKWADLSTGGVNDCRYLLQARRHKDGRVQFRVAQCGQAWNCNVPTMGQLKEVQP